MTTSELARRQHGGGARRSFPGWLLLSAAAITLALAPAKAQTAPPARTSLNVVVLDEVSKPLYQARLTLEFHELGKLKHPKLLSFSAKTDSQGRYRFVNIPKGTVRLIVTAPHHQTFSKEFELEKDNQVIEVKLKPPQDLL